ncbi:DNA-directed RNA polymerase subunit alpha C-terminal domain-containing protein [Arthrobacter sp. ISL-72]|uniref:DNA-directed RNA polymerase subunit alpha C-terminal domain-containing protein n=1 Tax=Arthrobacter sp. ISL-72 TaxID=2819114 RepID=UPI00203571A4|nr:DNA-directed RNA polymerase subunit alpha C-terminal domain-containing protein [Arthrobacter sp. ISL-72]
MPDGQRSLSPSSIELQLARPISELCLPARAANGLARHGVNTVGQLIARSRQDLKNEIHGLGSGSISEIEKALKREGLNLAAAGRAFQYGRPLSRHARNHQAWLAGLPVLKEADGFQ